MQITGVDETRLGAAHEVSADWQRGVPGQRRVTVAAVEAGEWHGAVTAVLLPGRTRSAELMNMWSPSPERFRGLEAALVEAVAQWAQEHGAQRLEVWVPAADADARRRYGQLGFVATRRERPQPEHPALEEVRMERHFGL